MQIITLDTETTGFSHETDRVVEIALVTRRSDGALMTVDGLCDPGIPIPAVARAVHHISDLDVAGAQGPSSTFKRLVEGVRIPGEEILFSAHNAPFDRGFIDQMSPEYRSVDWIDTYRCARHIFPDAPGYSNQVLRYHLDLEVQLPPNLFPHRAAHDAIVTHSLLERMLAEHPAERLVVLSTQPVVLKTVAFGKHRGELWNELPRDYLEWVLRQDMDADIKHTALHVLSTGGGVAASRRAWGGAR